MEYLKELCAFHGWVDEHVIASQDRLLWYTLMQIANAAYWQDPVCIPVSVLIAKSGLSKATIYRSRERLRELGLIAYEQRSGNQSAAYHLYSIASHTGTQNNDVCSTQKHIASLTETQEDDLRLSQKRTASLTETIYRHKDSTKTYMPEETQGDDMQGSTAGKKKRKPRPTFSPPSVEEVAAYCKERNNQVDAQRFWDYYNAADWHDKDGNPVKNWKQKMIAAWEPQARQQPRHDTRADKILT